MKSFVLPLLAVSALFTSPLSSHCQIPCGIYDDANVLKAMHTDFETIAKATKQITELSKDPGKNAHQLARWISNKESHAQNIQDVVSAYFLAQRLKVAEAETDKESYLAKLTSAHRVIVLAMKCKQSTDSKAVSKLHDELHTFMKHFGGDVGH